MVSRQGRFHPFREDAKTSTDAKRRCGLECSGVPVDRLNVHEDSCSALSRTDRSPFVHRLATVWLVPSLRAEGLPES
jgi:hypothetical protein